MKKVLFISIVGLFISTNAMQQASEQTDTNQFFKAAGTNNITQIEYLLHKVDINTKGYYGRTALIIAALNGRKEAVEILVGKGSTIDAKDDNGYTALHEAVKDNNIEIATFLINAGASLNAQEFRDNFTPLMYATRANDKEIVKLLLDRGANVDMQDKHGHSALIIAAYNGYTDIVEMLLDKSANPNLKDGKGKTALVLADKKGHQTIVDILSKVTIS